MPRIPWGLIGKFARGSGRVVGRGQWKFQRYGKRLHAGAERASYVRYKPLMSAYRSLKLSREDQKAFSDMFELYMRRGFARDYWGAQAIMLSLNQLNNYQRKVFIRCMLDKEYVSKKAIWECIWKARRART